MIQDLLDKIFDNHPEVAGGPFTWKAAQKGPLAQDLLKALEAAYKRGEDDLRKQFEAEEDKRQAALKAQPKPQPTKKPTAA